MTQRAHGLPRSTYVAAILLAGGAALIAIVRFGGLRDPGFLLTPGALLARPLDLAVLALALPLALRSLTQLGDTRATALTHALRLSVIPFAVGQVHVVLGGTPDDGFGAARALDLLQLALPLAGLMVQHVGAYAEKEGLATSQAGLSAEVEQRSLELQAAQARLSAANEFAEALNQPDMLTTYRSALHCLAQRLRTPFAALFAAREGAPPACRAAVGCDLRLLDAAEFSGEGLPAAVLRAGRMQSLLGPFDGQHLRVGAGLGELKLQSIVGWPVSFQGRCLGVIVTAHVIPPTFEQRALIASTLEQLGVRMSSAAAEEQRQRLIEDLERQSLALEAARCEADRASRVKSEILANVSHELRTPMNSIMGFTQRLLSRLGPPLGETDADALRAVERNSRQLLGLISDLLDVSRVEAGRVQLFLTEVDPCAVAREVVQELGPLAKARALVLTLARAPERLRLRADRERLRQVLTNLVSNAIKYTEHGTVTVRVAERDDSSFGPAVEIAVEDTGIGIPSADLPRLFQPFTQLDSSAARRAGGTGLGLTIAASLTRLHGGRLDVTSTAGQGSRFAVVLPALPIESDQEEAAAGTERTTPARDGVPQEPVHA